MAVKLELYRIFRTVAEEESISAAAKTLFISQSAVSQSIHQLEEQPVSYTHLRAHETL